MSGLFLLLSLIGLVGLFTSGPERAAAAGGTACFGCTNDSCGGACACFQSFGTIGNNRVDKNCGALGF